LTKAIRNKMRLYSKGFEQFIEEEFFIESDSIYKKETSYIKYIVK